MTRFAYLALFVLSAALTPLQVQAQPASYPLQLAANSSQGLDAAVQRIKQQTGGRILSAKTVNENGQSTHHIKVLMPSGKVRIFKVK